MKVYYKNLFVWFLCLGMISIDARSEVRPLGGGASSMVEMDHSSSLSVQQNKRKISGKVTDAATGEGLIGVTIAAKGTRDGTITDVDGNFTIFVSNETVLEISYVGYKNRQLSLKINNI